MTLTIETDLDYLSEGKPEFVLYEGSLLMDMYEGSLLMDSGKIDHINENQYVLTGKSNYKLCFINKSLVVLINDDQEITIFDEFKQGVVSYDQRMYE